MQAELVTEKGKEKKAEVRCGLGLLGAGGVIDTLLCCWDQPNLSCMPLLWNDAQAQSIRNDSLSTNGVREAAVDAGGLVLKTCWTRGREDMTRYLRRCE